MGFETDYQKKYGVTPSQNAAKQQSGGFESSYNSMDEEKRKKARQTAIELSKPVEKPKQPSFFEKAGKTISGITEKLGFKKKKNQLHLVLKKLQKLLNRLQENLHLQSFFKRIFLMILLLRKVLHLDNYHNKVKL